MVQTCSSYAYVVPIVGHPHFWPDQQDLPVMNDNSTIIIVILVRHWPIVPDPQGELANYVARRNDHDAYIPISQMISLVSG